VTVLDETRAALLVNKSHSPLKIGYPRSAGCVDAKKVAL
jgi:hypothetical protein